MKNSFLSKCLILTLFINISSATLNQLNATPKAKKNHTESSSQEKQQVFDSIPQINVDDFDKAKMAHILKNYGSFEVVGPSIDELSELALEALQETRQVLNLPIESLEKVPHDNFNGFQNVHKETLEAFQRDGKRQVRSQIAFHFKPYLPPRIPKEIKDLRACRNYYDKASAVLYRLYDQIADSFIQPDQKSIFREGSETSCLTLRKYFPGKESETGITPHTDFGLLTLVVSDHDGLEILEGKNASEGRWINASFGKPNKPRFYINVGDWLALQTGNEEFNAGIHRVPNVSGDKYSVIVFMNPPNVMKFDKTLITLDGVKFSYPEFLRACKNDYQGNLKKCSQHFLKL